MPEFLNFKEKFNLIFSTSKHVLNRYRVPDDFEICVKFSCEKFIKSIKGKEPEKVTNSE